MCRDARFLHFVLMREIFQRFNKTSSFALWMGNRKLILAAFLDDLIGNSGKHEKLKPILEMS